MIKLYLKNIATGVGAWLSLPQEDEEIISFIEEKHISTKINEEFLIADYETDELIIKLNQFSNVFELNKIVKEYESHYLEEQHIICAYLECQYNDEKAFWYVIEHLDDYYIIDDIQDESDLGYYLFDLSFPDKIDETLKRYFDYEAFGRDSQLEGIGDFTKYGFLFYR